MSKTRKLSSEATRLSQKVIIVFLMVLFLIQTFRAWDKYSKGDTMMVSKMLRPDKQVFPGVTICKGIVPGKFSGNVEERYEFIAKLDNWVLAAEFEGNPINLSTSPDWKFRNASRHLFVKLPSGFSCHTFTSPEEVLPKSQNGLTLYMAVDKFDFMFLVLHDSLQNIPVVDDLFGNTIMSINPPADDENQSMKDIAVDTVATMWLKSKAAPCRDNRDLPTGPALFECLENSYEETTQCKLPWNHKGENNSMKTLCNASELTSYENYMKDITENPSFSHIYNKTKCTHPCEQLTYSYTVPFELTTANEGYATNVIVRIYLKSNGVTYKKEVVVFDALEMIGNVGGYLGLLLGWSVLSIYTTVSNKIMKTE